MLYYFYTSIAGIALVVHLIINWRQLVDWRNAKSRPGALEFRYFLISLVLFFVSDILWGIFAELKCPRLLYSDTLLFFLTMALSIYAWTHFIVAYMELDGAPRRRILWTGRCMLAFFCAALAVNGFTGSFFTVDDQCTYAAGPLRYLVYDLLIALNALSSGITLFKMLRTEGVTRRRHKMFFVVGLTMTAAILLQLGDALLPIYSIGSLFGCCLLHVFFVEDDHDEMHRKEMLARQYEAQLEAERTANQAKSLFFSSVSHDIRTPLNAIIGFSELLERGVPDETERTRYISSIRSSGKVLARLVDDVLDLSKLESGKLEILKEPTDVAMAEDGRAALAALKESPDFDMVFSDLWMPEMDGNALAHAIRADAKLAHLPVYLVTADVEARNQAESNGFTGVLLKPITLEKLQKLFRDSPEISERGS